MRSFAVLSGLTLLKTPRLPMMAGLPLILAGLLATSCSSNDASQIKHDMKAPVRDVSAWNWNASSDDDYKKILAPLLGLEPSSILANDNPLVQRAQFWLDQVDASLRAKYPTQLANVPKPEAKVLRVGVPNAFVAPMPTCYDVPVETGAVGVRASDRKIFIDPKSGMLAVWPREYKCKAGASGSAGLALVKDFVAKFNAGASACKFALTASGSLRPKGACEADPEVATVGVSSGLVLMQTASFVTVHSGIMTIMPEAAFVSVLAHELGHYYRSHATATEGAYDYFYTLTPDEPAHKPAPEADKEHLGTSAVVASGILSAADNFPVVASTQKLRTDLYLANGSLVTQVAARRSAPAQCRAAAEFLSTAEFKMTMGMFPFKKDLTPEVVKAYLDSEKRVLACLEQLKFSSGEGLDGNTVGFDVIRALAANPTWPEFLTALSPAGQSRLGRVNEIVAARLGNQAPDAKTVEDAVLALSEGFAAQDEQSLRVLSMVHDQRIGQYTTEQEADDESAEWIADLGIDPAASVESMRSLGKGMKAGLGGNILAEDDCERLWKAGWLGADGSYSFVPVGNFTDPHHSVCYRMFNLDREIKAHKLAAKGTAPVASGPSWTELQSLAASLVPAAALDASFAVKSDVSPLVTRSGAMSCSYSSMYQGH